MNSSEESLIKVHSRYYDETLGIAKDRRRPSIKLTRLSDSWYGVRHTQMILLCLLLMLAFGMRVNLSVAIVAMTDPTINADFTTYDWDNQSVILSSFFWGYILPQIFAGYMSKKYGARWLLITAMTVCSVFTILIPQMAKLGSWGVMICRVMQGLSQGVLYPSIHTLLSKWVPVPERSRLGTFVFAGGPFGTVIALPITGLISGSTFGWPFTFYTFGAAGILWTLVFFLLGSNSPSEDKRITLEERIYIEVSLGVKMDDTKNTPTPWKEIVTSKPLWGLLVAHCAQNWGFWTLVTEMPTYLKNVLNFDIKSNGVLSAAPYFTMWIMSFAFSSITDFIINREYVTIGCGRKIANSVGAYIPAAALIILGFFGHGSDTTSMVMALLIIAVGINAAHMCGYLVNHIDLSPTHAGTLMGITNAISNIFSLLGPILVHYVVTDKHDINQWKVVFLIAATFYMFGNTLFVIFGSGDIQTWDTCDAYEETDTEAGRQNSKNDSSQ